MLARDSHALPPEMQNRETEKYLTLLNRRRGTLLCKRAFDITVSAVLLVVVLPLALPIALVNLIASCIVMEMGPQYDKLISDTYDVIHFINNNKTD